MAKQRNKIRVERARMRISQKDFAKEVGISRTYANLIENGQNEPKIGLAIRIAKFFKIDVEHLFDIDE